MNDMPWWRNVIAKIAEVPEDEFGERSEELAEMLDRALEAQRTGHSRKEGVQFLTASLNAVKQWLSEPGNVGNPAGHFFAAYLNGVLELPPLNLAAIARPKTKSLSLTLDVPDGGAFTTGDGSSTLALPGMMVTICMVDKPSVPTLGMLVERGADGMQKHLIEGGMSKSKADKMVREAQKALQKTRVEITPVLLGDWSGKRYSYDLPMQTVHHYCLTVTDRHLLITAAQFKTRESSLDVLESTIATISFEPSQ
jgi:hypothetical protein